MNGPLPRFAEYFHSGIFDVPNVILYLYTNPVTSDTKPFKPILNKLTCKATLTWRSLYYLMKHCFLFIPSTCLWNTNFVFSVHILRREKFGKLRLGFYWTEEHDLGGSSRVCQTKSGNSPFSKNSCVNYHLIHVQIEFFSLRQVLVELWQEVKSKIIDLNSGFFCLPVLCDQSSIIMFYGLFYKCL